MNAINVNEIARKFSVAPAAGIDKEALRNTLVELVDAMLPGLYLQNEEQAGSLAEAIAEAMSDFGQPPAAARKPRTDWQKRLTEVRDMSANEVKDLDYAFELKPIYDRITNEGFCEAKGFKSIPRPELLARGRADEEGNRTKVVEAILSWQDLNKPHAPRRDTVVTDAPVRANVVVRKARKSAKGS